MKMTDADSAKDLCRRFDELVNAPSGGSQEEWSEWQCDAAAELLHVAARLAADQQKGGGEVAWDDLPELESTAEFMRQCRLQWERRSAQISGYDNRKARKKAKQRAAHFANAERALSAPQPSIPAPAQQVDDEAVAADNYRWLRCGGWEVLQDPKYWRPEYGFDGAIAAARADVATNAALAHPPHADQETQG